MQLQNKELSASQTSVVLQKYTWRAYIYGDRVGKSNSWYDFAQLSVQECKYCTDTSTTASQEGGNRLNTNWRPADGASHRCVNITNTFRLIRWDFFIFIIGWRASASVLFVFFLWNKSHRPLLCFFRLLVKDVLLFSFSLSGLWVSGIFKGALLEIMILLLWPCESRF